MPENVNTSVLTIENAEKSKENDNRETMIKIDHVSMVFNMASEQLNNLKEYAIKLAKRELFFEGFKALDDISFGGNAAGTCRSKSKKRRCFWHYGNQRFW